MAEGVFLFPPGPVGSSPTPGSTRCSFKSSRPLWVDAVLREFERRGQRWPFSGIESQPRYPHEHSKFMGPA
jgi:hypothetical protein